MNESKHSKIRSWLEAGHTITGIQALELFSTYRLSSVIHRLKKEGMDIENIGTDFAIYVRW